MAKRSLDRGVQVLYLCPCVLASPEKIFSARQCDVAVIIVTMIEPIMRFIDFVNTLVRQTQRQHFSILVRRATQRQVPIRVPNIFQYNFLFFDTVHKMLAKYCALIAGN